MTWILVVLLLHLHCPSQQINHIHFFAITFGAIFIYCPSSWHDFFMTHWLGEKCSANKVGVSKSSGVTITSWIFGWSIQFKLIKPLHDVTNKFYQQNNVEKWKFWLNYVRIWGHWALYGHCCGKGSRQAPKSWNSIESIVLVSQHFSWMRCLFNAHWQIDDQYILNIGHWFMASAVLLDIHDPRLG
jgi:hypothetical protein